MYYVNYSSDYYYITFTLFIMISNQWVGNKGRIHNLIPIISEDNSVK